MGNLGFAKSGETLLRNTHRLFIVAAVDLLQRSLTPRYMTREALFWWLLPTQCQLFGSLHLVLLKFGEEAAV